MTQPGAPSTGLTRRSARSVCTVSYLTPATSALNATGACWNCWNWRDGERRTAMNGAEIARRAVITASHPAWCDGLARDLTERRDVYERRVEALAARLFPDDAARLEAFWQVVKRDVDSGTHDGEALIAELDARGIPWRPVLFDLYR